MMAGNPNGWWSMQSELRSTSDQHHHHHHHEQEAHNNLFISQTHPSNNNNSLLPVHQQYLHGSSSTSPSSPLVPFISLVDHHHGQDFPHSWSQLLLGGMASEQEEERFSTTPPPSHFQSTRVMNSDVKPEVNTPSNNSNNNLYENHQYHHEDHDQQQEGSSSVGISNNNNNRAWTQLIPASSPKSCITSLNNNNNNNINTNDNNNNKNINININSSSNNNNNNNNNNGMLDFSTNRRALQAETHQHADHSNSECNSTATGGLPKKPRLQSSSNPPLKVRKEKLGDRITSLHQLVSPFGKTDTASVLLEAIGYIRFLQGQIEALSSPYMGSDTSSVNNTHSVHGERTCLFPDHPGQDKQAPRKDLKSRGLCLVPISCTHLIGSENGADYWAQSLGGGF
ncbi:uncharacterized protein LOC141610926 isoform X2 [Silene latifolia]|uniref:uncharacterized protein LOC141610926 isoform X2 n=1 Tax=Silene latifolia TaxID=37657 RepID=UPI003D77CCDB